MHHLGGTHGPQRSPVGLCWDQNERSYFIPFGEGSRSISFAPDTGLCMGPDRHRAGTTTVNKPVTRPPEAQTGLGTQEGDRDWTLG